MAGFKSESDTYFSLRMKERKKVKSLSSVGLFVTPWTVTYQAPPSMGFPGKNTGVGCHFLVYAWPAHYFIYHLCHASFLHCTLVSVIILLSPQANTCVHAKLLQLCLTVCDPMGFSLPGSSVHGILQARILEWVTMPSSRGLHNPVIEPISLKAPPGKPHKLITLAKMSKNVAEELL